jgi:hypothetical protein
MKLISVIIMMTVFISAIAEARVFDLKSASYGTYFGGTVGSSNLSQQAWDGSPGTTLVPTTTNDYVRLNYSGEFGFLMAVPKVNLRFGIEYLQPQKLSDIQGKNASDQVDFVLVSNTRAIIPKMSVEFVVWKTNDSALIFGGSAGYAMVTMENRYSMTAQGTTDFSVGDYTEKATGTATEGEGFLGYEFIFSDNVTIFANLGYRYLLVTSLKHQNAGPVIGGSVSKDSPVLNQNGEARKLNMSAGQAALQFRFYF